MEQYIVEHLLQFCTEPSRAQTSMEIAQALHLREVSVSRTLRRVRLNRHLPFTVKKVAEPLRVGRETVRWWITDRLGRPRRQAGAT